MGRRVIESPACVVVLAAVGAAWPAPAAADDALGRGVEMATDARFSEAIEALEEAEGATRLSRRQLVSLYGHRAVVRFALGEREAMRADLVRLLAVDRDAELPPPAPPQVREAWERVKAVPPEPLRLVPRVETAGDTVRLSVRVEGRPAELVREVRLFARAGGGAPWTRGEGGEVRARAARGATVQWYAKALGPGGVVIARAGTRAAPKRVRAGASVAGVGEARAAGASPRDDTRTEGWKWWLVGGGAAVVVGGVVTAVALSAGGSSERTALSGPALGP